MEVSVVPQAWLCRAQLSPPHLVSPPPGPSWRGSCFPKQGLCQIASHSLSSDSSRSYSGNKELEERSVELFLERGIKAKATSVTKKKKKTWEQPSARKGWIGSAMREEGLLTAVEIVSAVSY